MLLGRGEARRRCKGCRFHISSQRTDFRLLYARICLRSIEVEFIKLTKNVRTREFNLRQDQRLERLEHRKHEEDDRTNFTQCESCIYGMRVGTLGHGRSRDPQRNSASQSQSE